MLPPKVCKIYFTVAVAVALFAAVALLSERQLAYISLSEEPRPDADCVVLSGHQSWVQAVAFSPDGSLLASVAGKLEARGEARLWDVAAARLRADLPVPSGGVAAVAFAPDGRTVVTGGWGAPVTLYDTATGHARGTLAPGEHRTLHLAYPATGGLNAVTYGTGEPYVRLWDLTANRQIQAMSGFSVAALSPDGRLLAVTSIGGLHVWDVTTSRKQSFLYGRPAPYALAFSPDSRLLAVGGADGTVTLLDPATGAEQPWFGAHDDSVTALAFSPDGLLLASGSNDRTVRLWDAATGRQRRVLRGHTAVVYGLAFSPDGRRLASGGFDTTVRLWDLGSRTARY